ncbi:MAG TPA: integrase core domain-containing protein [Actinomycetota bacterium]|nr:integrase core domain-containing protein [Actinomycetota bacterium]
MRKEFLADRTFPSLEVAQQELDAWVHDYNTERPHQVLEMATPTERFRLVPATKDASSVPVFVEEDQKGQWVLRRVGSNGVMSVDNQMFSVGNGYKGQLVDAFVDDTTIQVWHQNPPRQDRGPDEERAGSQDPGRRTSRKRSGGAKRETISRDLTGPTIS